MASIWRCWTNDVPCASITVISFPATAAAQLHSTGKSIDENIFFMMTTS